MEIDHQIFLRNIILKAFFSDSQTKELLVLKGGQALEIYNFSSRESYDIDFSIMKTKENVFKELKPLIKNNLKREFKKEGYFLFDFKFELRPEKRNDKIPPFWGGYKIIFKVIKAEEKERIEKKYDREERCLNVMRASAAPFGENNSTNIEMDFSYHEYTNEPGEIQITEDGYYIKIYRPIIMAYEKIRALCQHLPGTHLPKANSKRARSRDLYDIYTMIFTESEYALDEQEIYSKDNIHELREVFKTKEVPIDLLLKLEKNYDILLEDFNNELLISTPSAAKVGFEYIFNLVKNLMEECHNVLSNKSDG